MKKIALKMQYRLDKGGRVCNNGEVVINHVRHVVRDGYAKCNPSLNNEAWNVTEETSVCPLCYPVQVKINFDEVILK